MAASYAELKLYAQCSLTGSSAPQASKADLIPLYLKPDGPAEKSPPRIPMLLCPISAALKVVDAD